uniref:Uncharacterized protein n=1 Tax=Arundo donax TaxID=35708 RepID=A0A0A9D495_ARUDO
MQEISMHVWCQFAECVEELKNETIKEYKTDKFTLHKDEGQCLPEATCGKEEVNVQPAKTFEKDILNVILRYANTQGAKTFEKDIDNGLCYSIYYKQSATQMLF